MMRRFFRTLLIARQHKNGEQVPLRRGMATNQEELFVQGQKEPLQSCDTAFFRCLDSDACYDCFNQMRDNEVDWSSVTDGTKCDIVLSSLDNAHLCTTLGSGNDKKLFCEAFEACVVFDDDNTWNNNNDDADGTFLDCSKLTECDWKGIHRSFIGDGVCHDNYYSNCYNSAACNYDGGDCCEDTCKSAEGAYLECGSDGYMCRDPESSKCDPTLTIMCKPDPNEKKNDDSDILPPDCNKENESLYKLELFDSFGDGWETTTMKITVKDGDTKSKPIFSGGLEDGSHGTEYLCLSLVPTCYDVEVGGGMWGREASWYIHGYTDGSPAIASGGGSMKCQFSVTDSCENTCLGKSNTEPSQDPDYKDFKETFKCIDQKCIIQAEACRKNDACLQCFQEDIVEYCFTLETFMAVTDCAMCSCSDSTFDVSEFCEDKSAPGIIPIKPSNGGQSVEPKQCTPAEILNGSSSLMEFMQCMHNSKEAILVDDFDENNFGDLDQFEACAHGYADEKDHGGRTALSCLNILVRAIDEEVRPGEPTAAISQIASLLYNEGGVFCDCSKHASDSCPLCPAFYNFKTLLYESLDACKALDEIDCDAWNEFQKPCKANIITKFGSISLDNKDQCDYIVSNCGGVGPFPSFRRLDCEDELPTGAWDFYKQYEQFCYNQDNSPVPPVPVPVPTAPVSPSNQNDDDKSGTSIPAPPRPVRPSDQTTPSNKKPYVPPEERGKPSSKSSENKSKSHWFRNMVFITMAGGVGYALYKRRSEFSFIRYRRIGAGRFGLRTVISYLVLSSMHGKSYELIFYFHWHDSSPLCQYRYGRQVLSRITEVYPVSKRHPKIPFFEA